MKANLILRNIVVPFAAFSLVVITNYFLNLRVDGAFFTLYLIVVLITAYVSNPLTAILTTVVCAGKILIYDVGHGSILSPHQIEENYRLLFFLIGSLVSISFIFRLKSIAKENLKLRKGQEELVAVVSHDLRNPLSSIRINAELMLRLLSKENVSENVLKKNEVIIDLCSSMNVLITELVELSKIDQGATLNVTVLKTSDFLQKVRDLLEPLALKKNITLHVSDQIACNFECDEEKMLRVFSNIVGNAIKFTPTGGRVCIDSESHGNRVRFNITDTGPGISPDQLPLIFDRYWQSGLQAGKGMGLGLAIAKSIVDAHKGKISATSKYGEGTSFTITIPLLQ